MCTVVKINVYRVDRFQNYVHIMQNDGNTRRHSMRVLSFESRNIYILCFSLGDGDFGFFFQTCSDINQNCFVVSVYPKM